MKKFITISAIFLNVAFLHAQATTAYQFSGQDCNGNNVDLFADLNAGKAVILFYYMANCGACPPPATMVQTMANNILANHPGTVKGYAFPFDNTTTCTYSQSWVTNNNLTFYVPMDSGATQVAWYGGFGMPTVVLVGGTDHRVMYFTMSFASSDTTTMRDSILALVDPAGIRVNQKLHSMDIYPNPVDDHMYVNFQLDHPSEITIEVLNSLGSLVTRTGSLFYDAGDLSKEISVADLDNGVYFIRVTADGETSTKRIVISR